jgi:predicted phage terminase large subunit-like protein
LPDLQENEAIFAIVSGNFIFGDLMLPEKAPWLSEFEAEVSAFNKNMTHANDDQIDPMLDAIDKWHGKSSTVWDLIE